MTSLPSARSSGRVRVLVIAGVALVAAVLGGLLIVKSQRGSYVRETLAMLPKAEAEYAGGRFSAAASSAAEATARVKTHAAWFQPDEDAKIRDLDAFLSAQLALWTEVEKSSGGISADPVKARAELEILNQKARTGAPRANPLVDRIEPFLKSALELERESTVKASLAKIPEARQAYEQGAWDSLLSHLESIRKAVEALPADSRDEATRVLRQDLKPVEDLAAPVAGLRAIREGKDDGALKSDRIRDLIRGLADLKGKDRPLHQELLKAISDVDPETRAPVAGFSLPKEGRATLIKSLTKGGDLQVVGSADDLTVIELQGPVHRYAIRLVGNPPQLLIEVDRVRLLFPLELVSDREPLALETAADLSRALRATRNAQAFAEEAWRVRNDTPGICAILGQGTKATILMGGRLFLGTVTPDTESKALVEAFLGATRALEEFVRESTVIPEEIKGPVAALLKASHSRAPPADHLNGKFCRESVQAGYVETQVGSNDVAVTECLKQYRRAYGDIVRLRTRIEGRSTDGAIVSCLVNLEGDGYWRCFDPSSNTTTFSMIPRDGMDSPLAVHSVFAGRHEEFPAAEPVEVRMFHGVAGIVSRWSASGGKLDVEAARWSSAVTLGEAGAVPEHFGSGDWQVPPHALKVDARGQARELMLPSGTLKVESFGAIPAGPARRAAQDKFLQRCAEVLKTPGEFHLFFRYFVQYVLDSPVTTATSLIGSSKHTGDAHQDAYQTLDRWLNGKYLADCDDLAELYWTVFRRQNRPAFVLGVPGHATCAVAEKEGDGWTFFCVDTGPARQLKGPDLDGIVEKLLRTYDKDGSMLFDPRQMRFLFRFGGEQTRSDYYLDSRILRDPEYADLMIRVQEYWHFGFYALGIETMSKVLETDRMPANCQEIAGLYTRVGLWEEALKWTEAGIRGLDAKDQFTGLNDTLRVVQCLRELKRKEEATRTLKGVAERIDRVVKDEPKEADRYRRLRFQVAADLAECDLPWDGWALVESEVTRLVEAGAAAESLMAMVSHVSGQMQKAVRSGTALTDRQAQDLQKISGMLEVYYKSRLFEADDSNLDLARKYGQLFSYHAGVLGPEKAAAELIKPDYPKERRRTDGSALGWPWIRLSPFAYAIATARALDKDDPAAGGPKAAIAVIRALEAALPEIRGQGSLGPVEFTVLDLRLMRACLDMDEPGLRSVFDEMKRQAWGELYEDLSRTLGRAAEFMKLEDFEKVFRLYCGYGVPRRHYYGVVYSASAVDRRGHAQAASRICIERFPDDADMKREHALLQKLAK